MDNIAPQEVRIGDWISEGWKMFTEQWKGWVAIALGYFCVVIVPIGGFVGAIYVMMLTTMMSQPRTRGTPPPMPVGTILGLYGGMFVLAIVLLPLTVFIMGGAYRASFKQLRGGRVEFRDLFSARDCYWRLLGATLAIGFLLAFGFLLCIIPAFLVAGLLFFTLPLIVERDLGVFDAIRASRDVTRPKMFMFTLFAILVHLIASIGSQACYVGLLVTWPLTFTISAVAFRDCFGVEGAMNFSQKARAPQVDYGSAPPRYAPPPPQDQSIACPHCGGSLPATARFCYHCGTDLTNGQ